MHAINGTDEFRLTRVQRQRGVWQLSYSISNGLKPLIELRITVGRLGAARGLAALLYNLEPAMRNRRIGIRNRRTTTARARRGADVERARRVAVEAAVRWVVIGAAYATALPDGQR